jgi:hypothetical protein
MLESAEVPNQQALVAFVCNGIKRLGTESIGRVKVYCKVVGEEFPVWSQEVELVAQTNSTLSPVSSFHTVSSSKIPKKTSSLNLKDPSNVRHPKNVSYNLSKSKYRLGNSSDSANSSLLVFCCLLVGFIYLSNSVILGIICLLALIPAKIPEDKGRKFLNWWGYGFLLFIVAFIHALVIKEDEENLLSQGTMKKCPNYAEVIKAEANVCRYCSRDLALPNS